MTPSAKPREFWIFFQPENENTIEINIIEESDDSLDSTHYAGPDWDCYCTSCSPRTHVIEYSAFEKLAAALRKSVANQSSLLAENIYWREETRQRGQYSDALRVCDLQLAQKFLDDVRTVLKDLGLDREGV